ncbi:hypothetical protein D3C87_648300 [compost metagenome]
MNNLILAKIICIEEKRTTRSNYTRKMDSDKERIKDFVAVICIHVIRFLLNYLVNNDRHSIASPCIRLCLISISL